jgi:hypothetical protein
MVKRVAPLSFEAWVDYQLGGSPMSRGELAALGRLLEPGSGDGIAVRGGVVGLTGADLAEVGLSPREVRELREKLEPKELPDFDLDLSRMRTAESVSAEMEEAVPGVFD